MVDTTEVLKRVRDACLDLPGAVETLSFNRPTWQAGRMTFCVLDRYEGEDCVVFKTTPQRQAELYATGRYFPAAYGGKHGWTAARLGDDLDWDELETLIVASWRKFATKQMLAELGE